MGTRITSLSNNFDSTGKLKAAGINNASLSGITSLPSGANAGKMTLLSTQTASSDSSLSFTSGIDSTYDAYCFKFINIHPSVDDRHFMFNASTDSGSNYNVTKTTTFFYAWHNEGDTTTALSYDTGADLAQSTSNQGLAYGVGGDNDQSMSGEMWLYNPSSTTYVKHFHSTVNLSNNNDYSMNSYMAGYLNTTSAVDAIQFLMNGGNIDAGTIKLFGVSTS